MKLLQRRNSRRAAYPRNPGSLRPLSVLCRRQARTRRPGAYTGSELTGNCRLRWYEHLLRNPLSAPAEAEEFTRRTAPGASSTTLRAWLPSCRSPRRSWTWASGRLRPYVRGGLARRRPSRCSEQALVEAQTAYAAALAPLTKSEVRELTAYLYPVMVGQNNVGHTLTDRGTGHHLCDLMEKMDRSALDRRGRGPGPADRSQAAGPTQALPRDGQRPRRGRQRPRGRQDRHPGRRHRDRRQGAGQSTISTPCRASQPWSPWAATTASTKEPRRSSGRSWSSSISAARTSTRRRSPACRAARSSASRCS